MSIVMQHGFVVHRLQQALDRQILDLDHNLDPIGMHIRQTLVIVRQQCSAIDLMPWCTHAGVHV